MKKQMSTCDVVCILFDASIKKSFTSVTATWIPRIRAAQKRGLPVILVATKVDLLEEEGGGENGRVDEVFFRLNDLK